MRDIPKSAIESAIHHEKLERETEPRSFLDLFSTYTERPEGKVGGFLFDQAGAIFEAIGEIAVDAIHGVERAYERVMFGEHGRLSGGAESHGEHTTIYDNRDMSVVVNEPPQLSLDDLMKTQAAMAPAPEPDRGHEPNAPER